MTIKKDNDHTTFGKFHSVRIGIICSVYCLIYCLPVQFPLQKSSRFVLLLLAAVGVCFCFTVVINLSCVSPSYMSRLENMFWGYNELRRFSMI
jgi:hypothetical protein